MGQGTNQIESKTSNDSILHKRMFDSVFHWSGLVDDWSPTRSSHPGFVQFLRRSRYRCTVHWRSLWNGGTQLRFCLSSGLQLLSFRMVMKLRSCLARTKRLFCGIMDTLPSARQWNLPCGRSSRLSDPAKFRWVSLDWIISQEVD